MKLAVGSDEKTVLADFVVEELKKRGHAVTLHGTLKGEVMGWPDIGERVGLEVSSGKADEGVVFCWTGTASRLRLTRFPGSGLLFAGMLNREGGAIVWDDANVLAMSLRSTSTPVAKEILDSWFSSNAVTTGIDAELIDRAKALDARALRSTAK